MSCINCGQPGTDMEYNFVKAQAIIDAQQQQRPVAIYKSDSGQWLFIDARLAFGQNVTEFISQYYIT